MAKPRMISVNGRIVRNLRESRNQNRKQFLRATRISSRTLTRVEQENLASEETIKKLLRYLSVPKADLLNLTSQPSEHSPTDLAVLATFANEFLSHEPSATRVGKYGYFGKETMWNPAEDEIGAISYGELKWLWGDMTRCANYEALQVRFRERKGGLRRIFLYGEDNLVDEEARRTLAMVLSRHDRLGLEPRVLSYLDFNEARQALGVACDMFVVFRGKETFFIQFPLGIPPLVVRTEDGKYVAAAEACFDRLWKKAKAGMNWAKRQGLTLSAQDESRVDGQVRAIQMIARG